MGIYSHYSLQELHTLRGTLTKSLHDRLTKPTAGGSGDRNARFDQRTDEIRKEITAVCAEIDLRTGTPAGRPIYMV